MVPVRASEAYVTVRRARRTAERAACPGVTPVGMPRTYFRGGIPNGVAVTSGRGAGATRGRCDAGVECGVPHLPNWALAAGKRHEREKENNAV